MACLRVILLGIVQGIAEFLPISSSGHLVVVNAALEAAGLVPLPDVVQLNIVLHFGTLLSILVVYWRRIWRLLGQDYRVIALLAVGSFPAVVVGLPVYQTTALHDALSSPLLTGCMLPVTGAMLLWVTRCPAGQIDYTQMSFRQALVIGMCQAVAILPGISRSGATIVAGLAVGLRRDAAATFSFLLAIIAIAGASTLELQNLLFAGPAGTSGGLSLGSLAVAAAVSFATGVAALLWLLRLLQQGRLQYFAYWCIPLGAVVIAWQLLG